MKNLFESAALVCLIPFLSFSAEWKIDPNHSTAGFAVRHMMVSTVKGRFTDLWRRYFSISPF